VPAGLSNDAIGELTYRSGSTVKAHLSRAMAKLGVANRSQLAVIVDRAGLEPGAS
jgi:DNA-binding NarL/FixJ family response regulator